MKISLNIIILLIYPLFVLSATVLSAIDTINYGEIMNHSSLPDAIAIEEITDNNYDKDKIMFNCYDSFGIGYIGQVPHPTNCSCFLQCVEQSPGHSAPIVFPCNENLQFSLDHCQCRYEGEAVCFDLYNIDHETRRLSCAQRIG